MKLLYSPTSPYVRKIVVLLTECCRLDEITLIEGSGTPIAPDADVIAKNPLGKVPALVRDAGPTLFDSRVISRFLDAEFDAGLYPEPPRLWDTLTLEALSDGILDAAILMVYEWRARPEAHRDATWVEAQWSKIARALDVLESRWISHLTGPFDMGQIAVGCALGYLDFRHGDRAWRSGHPELSAWYDTISERPSMQSTRPPEA